MTWRLSLWPSEVRIAGERSEQKDLEEDAVGDEVAGERDDEGRESQPRDERALNQAEHRAGEKAGEDGRHPVPVGGDGLDELDGDRRADRADEPDRQVDLAEDQRESLGHGEDHEHRRLLKEVDQVARRRERRGSG